VWCAGGKVLQDLGGCASKARSYGVGKRRSRVHTTNSAFQPNLKETPFRRFLEMSPFLIRILLSSGCPKRMSPKSKHNVFVYLARREADGVERWSDDKIAKRSR
jgi:hypothetical protein